MVTEAEEHKKRPKKHKYTGYVHFPSRKQTQGTTVKQSERVRGATDLQKPAQWKQPSHRH